MRRVLLTCALGPALERVQADPEHGLSQEAALLRRTHERFRALRPGIAADLVADTGTTPVTEVCDRVDALLRPVDAAAPGATGAALR